MSKAPTTIAWEQGTHTITCWAVFCMFAAARVGVCVHVHACEHFVQQL